jgi:hypothetical protein
MYLRIVKGAVQAGQIEEMAKRWEANVGARITQQPGFHHAYFVGDRETGAVTGVTLWDTLPDEAVMRQAMQEFQAKLADITTGVAPTVETYEVLVEL